MARPDKAAAVAEIAERFRSSSGAVLTEYRGLTVAQLQELRRSLGENATYAVVKNTLTKIAAKRGRRRRASTTCSPARPRSPSSRATRSRRPRACVTSPRHNPPLVIKGGVLDGKAAVRREITKLADLESREVLLAKLAGAMKASLQQRRLPVRRAAGAGRPHCSGRCGQKAEQDPSILEAVPASRPRRTPPTADEAAADGRGRCRRRGRPRRPLTPPRTDAPSEPEADAERGRRRRAAAEARTTEG